MIKSDGSKKFIKNYKLNSQQLLTLNESLSQNYQEIDINYKSNNCHTLIPSSVPNKYRHPEYREQNLFTQNSFEETLNAKYGNYKKRNPTMKDSELTKLGLIISEIIIPIFLKLNNLKHNLFLMSNPKLEINKSVL